MPMKEDREYRSFAVPAPVQDESKPYTVRGYFTTFEEPYELYKDWDGNSINEVVGRDALSGTDIKDCVMQYNHGGMVMARTRNGSLVIGTDDHGAWCEASLGGCAEGRNLYEAITNGLVDRMSFGFRIAPDGWEWDEATNTGRITRIEKLYDVSAVDHPANDGTEIHTRTSVGGAIDAKRQELALTHDRDRRARAAASLRIL